MMEPLTPERLAEIRASLQRWKIDHGMTRWWEGRNLCLDRLASERRIDAADGLLAEVDRLRAQVAELEDFIRQEKAEGEERS